MTEVWKPIKNYEGYYKISNLGRIMSCYSNKIMEPGLRSNGYLGITLSKNGVTEQFSVHRLVAQAFIPNDDPTNKIIINHKNEIKTDNRVENLEWCTHKYNANYGTSIERMRISMKEMYNSEKGKKIREQQSYMHTGLKQSEETINKRVEKNKIIFGNMTKEERSLKFNPIENREKHSEFMKRRMSELTDEKRKELYGHKLDDDIQFKMRFSRDYGRKFEDIEFISPFDLNEKNNNLVNEFECNGQFVPLHIDDFRFPVIKGKRGIIHVKHEIEDRFNFDNDTVFLN